MLVLLSFVALHSPPLSLPTNLELLRIQCEDSLDGQDRVRGLHGIVIACTGEDEVLWMGAEVPDALAAAVVSAFAGAPRSPDPRQPPPALALCGPLLGDGPLKCRGEPRYLFPDDLRFTSDAHLVCSGEPEREALRPANPGNWHPVEWDELLDGQLGPWAMAVEGALVTSICHTPGPVWGRGAECGVWTRPGFRGRGLGAAATAAWAGLLRAPGRHLFYSTDAENLSSQRLTQRLGLRPLGWTWRLDRAAAAAGGGRGGLHPLSRVRSGDDL
jgi:hypothetical protein